MLQLSSHSIETLEDVHSPLPLIEWLDDLRLNEHFKPDFHRTELLRINTFQSFFI